MAACLYDSGDCTPGSCLLALPTATQGVSSAPTPISEFGMGMGGADGGTSVGGAGPPVVAAGMGTVWYDLSSLGLQSLVIPANSISMSDDGGGLVDDVHLAVSMCEPLNVGATIAQVAACADEVDDVSKMSALYNDTDPAHAAPIGLLVTSRHRDDDEEEDGCIVASLGAWHTMDKQLLDPLYPTQGVQLEFANGSPCEEADETSGDGFHHTRLNLICAPDVSGSAERVGWRRMGCTWEFSIRFAGACALSAPPSGGAALGQCAMGCLPNWLGDGVCDRLCNTTGCAWDHGDCSASRVGLPTAATALQTPANEPSVVEQWLCGVHAMIKYRHGHGGGGGGEGSCVLVESSGRMREALNSVTPTVVVTIAVCASLLVACLCITVACLCARHLALKHTSEQYRAKIAQYQSEARRANPDELESMTLDDGDDEGGIAMATVHRVVPAGDRAV